MRRRPKRTSLLLTAALGLIVSTLSGCGYMLGPQTVQGVRTVHVPVFRSDGFRRNADYLLTEAVQNEIKSRSGYRLADAATADTILEGRIVDTRKDVLTENSFDDPRELQISLGVKISWVDRRNGRILQQHVFPLSRELAQQASQVSFAPEVGHSMATAEQEAVRRLAARIVDLMEPAW